MYIVTETQERLNQLIAEKEDAGFTVSIPCLGELQIDIDDEEHKAVFDRVYPMVRREFRKRYMELSDPVITPSKSGYPQCHIRVSVLNSFGEAVALPQSECLILQACLGSDPVREVLNYFRYVDGIEPASILFEKEAA